MRMRLALAPHLAAGTRRAPTAPVARRLDLEFPQYQVQAADQYLPGTICSWRRSTHGQRKSGRRRIFTVGAASRSSTQACCAHMDGRAEPTTWRALRAFLDGATFRAWNTCEPSAVKAAVAASRIRLSWLPAHATTATGPCGCHRASGGCVERRGHPGPVNVSVHSPGTHPVVTADRASC